MDAHHLNQLFNRTDIDLQSRSRRQSQLFCWRNQNLEINNAFQFNGYFSRIYSKANPNAVERTYVNSFSYMPDGRIEKLRLGNYRWEWAKFNERLQVTELNLGSGVQDASLWKLKYEYGEINVNGDVDTNKNKGNIA